MGRKRRGLGFFAGAVIGAAGTAAYFLWREGKRTPATSGEFAQGRAPTPRPTFDAVNGSASARLQNDVQADQEPHTTELAGMRNQLPRAEQDEWQVRLPSLTTLGKQLAAMPAAKTLAADRAVAAQHLPHITADPQDLARIDGIGATYEQRLYTAGIGSYWEVANLSDEDFAPMLELTEFQQAAWRPDEIRAQAMLLAEASGTVGQLWEGVAPDDLEPIKGIGKVFEQRLYDAGIRTYAALAAATPEELAAICGANMPVAPDYASWIEQARAKAPRR